jgi:CRP-like cAMP-binding protein
MFSSVINYMSQFHPIYHLKDELSQYMERRHFPKKSILLNAGEIADYTFFLEHGLMRAFIEKDGNEITTWVAHESMFVTAIQSFYSQNPSFESVETLENCSIVLIRYKDMMTSAIKDHDFCLCMFNMLQKYNIFRDNRTYMLRSFSAYERYEWMIQHDPDLVRRTTNKVMASYLDIKQETLSRVRTQMKKEGVLDKLKI